MISAAGRGKLHLIPTPTSSVTVQAASFLGPQQGAEKSGPTEACLESLAGEH